MFRILLIGIVTAFYMFRASPVLAEECDRPVDRIIFWGCDFKTLSWVEVHFETEIPALSARKTEFERDIRSYIRRDMPLIDHEILSIADAYDEFGYDGEEIDHRGGYSCNIWTVGDDFPVAFHIECFLYSYDNDSKWESYTESKILGYGNSENVIEASDNQIEEFIEELAGNYYDSRLKSN